MVWIVLRCQIAILGGAAKQTDQRRIDRRNGRSWGWREVDSQDIKADALHPLQSSCEKVSLRQDPLRLFESSLVVEP